MLQNFKFVQRRRKKSKKSNEVCFLRKKKSLKQKKNAHRFLFKKLKVEEKKKSKARNFVVFAQ